METKTKNKHHKYPKDVVKAAIEIVKLVGKYGSFNHEAIKELYKKGTLFNNIINNPKALNMALDIIVKEVDGYMDEARQKLAKPDKNSQKAAEFCLKFADLAIAAESSLRVLREKVNKMAMLGIRRMLAVG